jgi:hypothetical protein
MSNIQLVRATLDGPGISAQSATCAWNSRRRYFQCDIATPNGPATGKSNAYTITASEDVGAGFITAPPVGAAINPETVYFK